MVIVLAALVIGFGLLVIIPVVAIMSEHQRKMARILQGVPEKAEGDNHVVIGLAAGLGQKRSRVDDEAILDELRALRNDVADLRLQVASLQGHPMPPLPQSDFLADRVFQQS